MSWTEPPWSGWIATTGDALIMLEAARRGVIPRVTRRLVDAERKMICSGSVFVFDEDESGIKRWTDGLFWSPSRILGNFLLYRETDKRGAGHRRADPKRKKSDGAIGDRNEGTKSDEGGPNEDEDIHDQQAGPSSGDTSLARPKGEMPKSTTERNRERTLVGSLTNSYKFKPNGLMKKTFSLTIAGVSQHLISYYSPSDVESGRLRAPSSIPELASLEIAPEYLDKTHFRIPPRIELDRTGRPRYIGEADDDVPIDTLSGLGSGLPGIVGGGQSTARSLLHDVPLLPLQDAPSSTAIATSRRQKRGDPYPTSPIPKPRRRGRTNPEDGPSPPGTAIGQGHSTTTGMSPNALGGAGSSPEDSTFGVYAQVPPTSAPGASGGGGSGAYTYGYPPSYPHYAPHHPTHHSQAHGHGHGAHGGHHVGQPNSAPVGGSFDTSSVYGLGDTLAGGGGTGVTVGGGPSSSYGTSSFGAGPSATGASGSAAGYGPYGWGAGGAYGSAYATGAPSASAATPRGAQGQAQAGAGGQGAQGGVSVALNPVHGAHGHGMYGMADERRR